MTTPPFIRPGEIAGWPKLQLVYRTDADRIADLLPPGFAPGADPHVHLNIYCVPVLGEPEYGVSTKVPAVHDGRTGFFSLGLGIDQEAAVFISQELNGQPKFPCAITFFRRGDHVEARCTHQGYTFLEFRGAVTGTGAPVADFDEEEWWIKSSRAVGGVEKQYDLPPFVVRVQTTNRLTHVEQLDGDLVLRDSPWDPYTELLPMHELLEATLVTHEQVARSITRGLPLDPDAFWPYADTIGGSRWPGDRGGPRRRS